MRQVFRNRKTGARRFGKKFGGRRGKSRKPFKGRFSRKNDANKQNIKGLIIPKTANVKLSTTQDYEYVQGTTGPLGFREVWIGNSIVPRLGTGTFGGQIVSAGDNAGVEFAVAGQNNKYAAGATEWAEFFDNYYCFGSTLNVEVINHGNSAARLVLLAVDNTTPVSELDAYTYEQLLAYPGVKKRYLGLAEGGNNRAVLKSFRKTKHMLGFKDLLDQDRLKYPLFLSSTNPTFYNDTVQPVSYWYWYFRAIPANDTTQTILLSATFKHTGYHHLVDRDFITTQNVNVS